MFRIEVLFVAHPSEGWFAIGGFPDIEQAKQYCFSRLRVDGKRIYRIQCNNRIIASYEDPEAFQQ